MEVPSSDPMMTIPSESVCTKPVPRPFSIEALMSDCGPRRTASATCYGVTQVAQPINQNFLNFNIGSGRDTDSDGSLDMDLAQDLSRQSQKDGEFPISHTSS